MPYKWTLTSGSLPPGLTLTTVNSGRSGFLKGQPTKIGTYNWRYTVTDDSVPDPLSAFNDYTMTISSSLYLVGNLIDDFGRLPNATKGVALNNAYNEYRLAVQELGSFDSVFSVSLVSGNKPAWLTIAAGATTNVPGGTRPIDSYCTAPINFTGTPTDVGAFTFTIRISSTSGAFQDLPIELAVVNEIVTPQVLGEYWALSADKTSIEEGETVRVYLYTTNQTDGATIPYVIGGVSAADINVPLSGNFTVNSTVIREPIFTSIGGILTEPIIGYREYTYYVGHIDITATADLTTEGTETMIIALPNVKVNQVGWVTSLPISIFDTSLSPAVIKIESTESSVQEGGSFEIKLTHTRSSLGTIFNYNIEGVTSDDLFGQPLGGSFKIGYNGDNQMSPADLPYSLKTFQIKPNGIVDTNKKFKINVPSLNLSTTVNITDANPTYSLSATSGEIKEGQTVTFTLFTTTVADGTTIPYRITGVSISDIGDALGNPISLTGNFTINNNLGSVTIRAIEDLTTESGTETMTFSVPSLGLVKQVNIIDSSTTPDPINYTMTLLAQDNSAINADTTLTEGDSFFVQIDSSAQAAGSGVRYSISGLTDALLDTTNAVQGQVTSLSGTWTMFSREFLGFPSSFYVALVKTKSDGGTNNLRTVTVSLPDLNRQASFKLKSKPVTITPPPPPAPPPPPPPPPASADPVVLTVAATPTGYVGVNYNYIGSPVYVSYEGGTGPLTWSVSSGSIPTGMTAATENGNNTGHLYYLSGAPTTVGTYSFVITGTDTLGISDTLSLSITVQAPPNNTGGSDPGSGGTAPGGSGPDGPDKVIDDIFADALGL